MKKLLCITVLCLSLAGLGFASGFSFKATGGLSLLMGGNYNDIVEGRNAQFVASVSTVTSQLKKLSLGMTFEGEIIYHVTPSVGIGVGSGYITANNESSLAGAVLGADVTRTFRPTVTAIPVMLNLHFFLPLSPMINFHLYAGPGVYFTTVKFDDELIVPVFAADLTNAFRPDNKTVFGVQGGLGLELGVANAVFLVLDVQGRWVDVKDLIGTETDTGTVFGLPVNATFSAQKLWYVEANSSGTFYADYRLDATQPSGVGLQNVKDGIFSLTGITFQAGIRVRL